MNSVSVKYCSFLRRMLAFVIDLLIAAIIQQILISAVGKNQIITILSSIVLVFVTFILMPLIANSSTIGQKILGMKTTTTDFKNLTFLMLFLRTIVLFIFVFLLMPITLISCIFLEYTPTKQSLYDLIFKTVVIRV